MLSRPRGFGNRGHGTATHRLNCKNLTIMKAKGSEIDPVNQYLSTNGTTTSHNLNSGLIQKPKSLTLFTDYISTIKKQ